VLIAEGLTAKGALEWLNFEVMRVDMLFEVVAVAEKLKTLGKGTL
jgi:hypothetical protein